MASHDLGNTVLHTNVGRLEHIVEDIKRITARGREVTVTVKEAHISEKYKGEIYAWSILEEK